MQEQVKEMKPRHHTDSQRSFPSDWWKRFFREVYYRGDQSLEGHVDDRELSQNARTARECKAVLQLLRPLRGTRILDCPCGEGRHAIRHAKGDSKLDLVGVDLCEDAVEHAKQQAKRKRVKNCHFVAADMRSLPLSTGSFDYVLNLFLSFGFFQSDDDNLQVLHEFARVLAEHGTLLVHTDVNPDRIDAGEYGDRHKRTLSDGSELTVSEEFNRATRRLQGIWRIHDPHGNVLESAYSVRIYTHEEMTQMLRDVGFQVVEVHAFPPSKRPIEEVQEIAYIAKKRR